MNNTLKIRIYHAVLLSLIFKTMRSPFMIFHVMVMRKTFLGFLCISNQNGSVKNQLTLL